MSEVLSPDALQEALSDLPGWSEVDGEIVKTYKFRSYKDGLAFATVAGYLADAVDHHPDLLVGYQKVRVSLSTHSASGITQKDIDLASQLESLPVLPS
jgi:4a-hydroxytetrahydrobiopterin dehydratase